MTFSTKCKMAWGSTVSYFEKFFNKEKDVMVAYEVVRGGVKPQNPKAASTKNISSQRSIGGNYPPPVNPYDPYHPDPQFGMAYPQEAPFPGQPYQFPAGGPVPPYICGEMPPPGVVNGGYPPQEPPMYPGQYV
ncbi:uncharacterized protein TM35_000201740 [Trypanosoma theileri]|uniref:Uncharacterized protein n=1 Tax=Trypanosoma theileri TaxID=67003 RepID=A0A1X0NSR8_9TRYP|nr:uncharacterized protein TM35_000201740 [Trypanosoma theileri]ORC87765.1 hypothetical protein TM35_000201740 [Trypanosoma theileri]